MPVFLFLGRHDHVIAAETSAAYFEGLAAPSKRLVWFEESAHEPPFEEPFKFNQAIVELVKPVLDIVAPSSGTRRRWEAEQSRNVTAMRRGTIRPWCSSFFPTPLMRSVRARVDERTRSLPGDELIEEPIGSLDHAITIRRPRHDVWPWLAQMGAGSRAGWYSYDFLDNGRQPSAERIIPELQQPEIGTIFPAAPDVTDGFTLLAFEPERFLVLGLTRPGGAHLMNVGVRARRR